MKKRSLKNTYPRQLHLSCSGRIPAAALCFSVLFALPAAAALRPATRITWDGCTIGYTASTEDASHAVNTLEQTVSDFTGKDYALSGSLEMTPSLAFVSQLDSEQETVASLAQAADDLDMLAVLTVDGQTVGACATVDEVQQALDTKLNQYKNSEEDTARFSENVHVAVAPAPNDACISAEALSDKLEQEQLLDVEVTSTVHYTEAIPHETLWVENAQMDQNTTEVIMDGKDGEAEVEAEVVSVNGVETERTIVSRALLARASNAVVAYGTRNIGIGTGDMIAPLTSYRFTSAFKFRDGRWHKGVDLATEVGSPVYAADNGKVVVSEYSDSFGNYIIIDHANGLKTLYAHNSLLLVQAGDTIAKGTQIAVSGNTGRSSGPHVHFEVHRDGIAVNPELYVALGPVSE